MTAQDLGIFGPVHFAIIAATPALALLLAFAARRIPASTHRIRLTLAWVLVLNEVATQIYRYHRGWLRFPDMLPLQLSDLTLWMTIAALFTLRRPLLDLVYYLGVAGAGNAVLTPELFEPVTSLPSLAFFVAHSGVVIAVLYLVWSRLHRPTPGSLWRAFLAVNVWAGFLAVFNTVFQTNYMFLCRKPATASLLDLFGPWPVYIAVTEAIALVLFTLLWLPYRRAALSSRSPA